ncbi:MAG: acyltransferase [Parasporobacterium sp.]|nr:acyltransferase [Parasporobacterium sp.]
MAMLFVIALHVNPKPYENGTLWQELFLSVFFSCNGLFFMMSGRFALAKEMSGVREILGFYKRKLFTIFIPFLFFAFLYCLLDLCQSEEPLTAGLYFQTAFRGVLGDLSDTYFWFLFALIGMVLSAPFLGRMVQKMKDPELHLLAAIGLIWEILTVYIGKNAGLGFGYNSWLLNGWPYYYFLGYYVWRVFEKSPNKKGLMLAGAAAFLINGLWTWQMPAYSYNAHDLSPLYTIFVAALYLFLGSLKPKGVCARIVTWIAAVSYYVYLVHRILLKLWINGFHVFSGKLAEYLFHLILCVILSLLAAFLFHLAYRPLLKKIRR